MDNNVKQMLTRLWPDEDGHCVMPPRTNCRIVDKKAPDKVSGK